MNRSSKLSPGCGSRRFASEIAAEKALAKARLLPGGADDDRKVKPCKTWPGCDGWHLAEPATDTGPDKATREAVYERDGWACVCCGRSVIGKPRSLGHRKRRSQGGTNDAWNLLTFQGLGVNPLDPDDHHARIDSRTDPADEAQGFTVRSHQDPASVPVMIHGEQGGALMYLTAGFEYTSAVPERGAA